MERNLNRWMFSGLELPIAPPDRRCSQAEGANCPWRTLRVCYSQGKNLENLESLLFSMAVPLRNMEAVHYTFYMPLGLFLVPLKSRSNSFMQHLTVHTAGTKSTPIKHHPLLQIMASEDNGPFLMSCIPRIALLVVIFSNMSVTGSTPFYICCVSIQLFLCRLLIHANKLLDGNYDILTEILKYHKKALTLKRGGKVANDDI